MEKINKIGIILILAIVSITSSCVSEEGPFFVEIDEPIVVSYSADIQPIFVDRCIQCHDDTHSTALDLREGQSYNLLVNVTSGNYAPAVRIEPFSTENSVLWHKINGDDVFGGMMPPIGEPLSTFQIQQITTWIEEGALNN